MAEVSARRTSQLPHPTEVTSACPIPRREELIATSISSAMASGRIYGQIGLGEAAMVGYKLIYESISSGSALFECMVSCSAIGCICKNG